MGWADERAAQIKTALADDAARTSALLERRVIVSNYAGDLWEALVVELERLTKEFAAALPLAKERNLQALRLNENNLTIMTNAFPLIKFQLLYDRGAGISGTLTETFSGMSETRTRKLRTVGFTTDRDLQPCLTDGSRYLPPSLVAEELMEKVAEFFEKASKMPSFL